MPLLWGHSLRGVAYSSRGTGPTRPGPLPCLGSQPRLCCLLLFPPPPAPTSFRSRFSSPSPSSSLCPPVLVLLLLPGGGHLKQPLPCWPDIFKDCEVVCALL